MASPEGQMASFRRFVAVEQELLALLQANLEAEETFLRVDRAHGSGDLNYLQLCTRPGGIGPAQPLGLPNAGARGA
jgi:hypothetical protein